MGGRGGRGGPGPGTGKRRAGAAAPGSGSGIPGSGAGSAGSSGGGYAGVGNAGTGRFIGGGGGGAGSGGGVQTPNRTPQEQPTKPKTFPSAQQARKWFASIWPSKDKYEDKVREEFATYSTNIGYQTINTALRDAGGDISKFDDPAFVDSLKDFNGNPYSDYVKQKYIENIKERIANMDAGFDFAPEIPETIQLARGTRWHEFKNLGITGPDDDLHQLLGKTYVNDAYTSTSVGGKAAMDYMPVQLTVTVPKGIKGVYMAGDAIHSGALSTLPTENEFLLPRGTEFYITNVFKNDEGKWEIEVEVLLP
ncbi:ADP-ribosyltransferase exoenzyme family protein [Mycolicibacterium hassiacum DSM 44199]|uniref:ADP-ribosyltransferase exoenzyme family protein n=1 Tax=Mycolicibacterium hassiacum (strain DSM 44199 / CIP 105218 / JCM 12690 / 3849) TaxID=1122247 RepID=K5BJE8_MYCHD|nr:ADP-ribosyltransferase exoenzyme family protein [Mycolicibacterium hassiacum DSM 44199]